MQHLGASSTRARAQHVFRQIQQGEGERSIIPRASQNIAAAAMIILSAPEPSIDEGKHIHKELQGMLEAVAVQ